MQMTLFQMIHLTTPSYHVDRYAVSDRIYSSSEGKLNAWGPQFTLLNYMRDLQAESPSFVLQRVIGLVFTRPPLSTLG